MRSQPLGHLQRRGLAHPFASSLTSLRPGRLAPSDNQCPTPTAPVAVTTKQPGVHGPFIRQSTVSMCCFPGWSCRCLYFGSVWIVPGDRSGSRQVEGRLNAAGFVTTQPGEVSAPPWGAVRNHEAPATEVSAPAWGPVQDTTPTRPANPLDALRLKPPP